MVRVAIVVLLTLAAIGIVVFTIPRHSDLTFIASWLTAGVAALCLHAFVRRYWLAAILAACTTTFAFHIYVYMRIGDFVLVAVAVTLAHAFVVALVVGLPFLFCRRSLPPPTRCQNCGFAPTDEIWGVCPVCGQLLDSR
jgi:hypothetical protein